LAALLLSGGWLLPAHAQQDPSFLVVSGGYYDFNRQKHPGFEFGAQYRSDQKLWIFQPMVGVMRNSHASTDIYAGVSLDIFFGSRFVVRPSFAPSLYLRGAGQDLGHPLEFRSAIEFAYRFASMTARASGSRFITCRTRASATRTPAKSRSTSSTRCPRRSSEACSATECRCRCAFQPTLLRRGLWRDYVAEN
jgi:hypothetical protein